MSNPTWQDAVKANRPQFVQPTVEIPTVTSSIHPWTEGSFSIWITTPSAPLDPLSIVYDIGMAQN